MDEGTTTALVSPTLDHIIERPRLIAMLEEGDARVTLLVAPAGYGKTTLARQWSARQRGPVAWYRTVRASGDVAALAVGLDELLDRTVPQPHRDPRRVGAIAAVNAHPHPLARALVSTYASLPPDLLLVLDEWEAAGTEEAEALVAHLVDELDIRVFVTSRTRPPWFSPRLTTYGEGLEIGIDALAMTDDEALAVLSARADGSTVDRRPLLATARGWPAVLGLAAMRAATDLPPTSMPAKTLYDFLASELLDSAPEEMRWGLTLLSTAAVGDVATAELLLGEATGRVLEAAARRNLVRVEGDLSISLHPLLRDLLVDRTTRLASDEIPSLLRTLRTLLTAERWDEALATAEAIPEADFIYEALSHALPHLLTTGRLATLRRWVAAGRSVEENLPLIDYAGAEVALRDAAFERAISLGSGAAQLLSGDLASRAHLVAARAANLADRLNLARRHFAEAEGLAASTDTKAAAMWGSFVQAVDDELPDAADVFAIFQQASAPGPELTIRAAHGRIRLALLDEGLRGELDDAEVVDPLLNSQVDPMVRSSFLNIQSTALSVAGRYATSLRAAELEQAIADEFELEFVLRHALVNRARSLAGLRETASAERCLVEVERRLASDDDLFLLANISIERCRLYLTLGDLQRAHACLFLPAHPRLNRGTRGEYLALRAVVLAARGDYAGASLNVRKAQASSRLLEVRLLAAVATCISQLHQTESHGQESATALFRLAYDSGGLDPIVMGCRASTDFACAIAGDERERDSLAEVLHLSMDAAIARHLGLAVPRSIKRTPKLSPREHEIHQLIAQGLTNAEISALLFISPPTTKVHVRHIFEKLGVRSRVDAARLWASEDA